MSHDPAAVPHHPSKPAGRLSRYPTRTPSVVSGHVQTRSRRPAARSGPLTGPARGLRGRCLPTLERMRDLRRPWRTLLPAGRPIPPGYAPRGASRPQQPRPTGPPRGSGAAAPSGALRAIDRRGRVLGGPAARAAFGGSPKPALVATQGGTARPGPHVFCLASTDTACTGAERRRRHPDRWVWGRLDSAACPG